MNYFSYSIAVLGLRLRRRLQGRLPLPRLLASAPETLPRGADAQRYKMSAFGAFIRSALGAAPPFWREAAAEFWLRRAGAPGPASEHVLQYLLSAQKNGGRRAGRDATVAKGADDFYERQYRQYLNAKMGVFAMTAKLALLGSAGAPSGWSWRRSRPVFAAMVEEADGAPPVIVLDHQTVAVPLLLPAPAGAEVETAIDRWLADGGPMPPAYRRLVDGDEIHCAIRGARARRRTAVGALIEVVDAARNGGKLAILALNPHDPDAMGLHITLFATQALKPEAVERDYGLDAAFLQPWRHAAWSRRCELRFCVGGVEEVFTQCSQNLFVKQPSAPPDGRRRAARPRVWSPAQSLERLLASQFELMQVTASASGLPGASPRNGDMGKAAFVARRGARTIVLFPYFAGNAVHGHAAKLWSNPRGALMIRDDHATLSAITLAGPSRVVSHHWVEQTFPDIAKEVVSRRKRNGTRASDPEYWFEQEVADVVQQIGPLAPHALDPARPACSIHAAGQALHGKKPAYFGADSLPAYDRAWQHEREAEGRPIDPSGVAHRYWEWEAAPALAARLEHLERSHRSAPAVADGAVSLEAADADPGIGAR